MSQSNSGPAAETAMTDVLDDAIVCISGNRYSRKANGWGSPTARGLSLDTIARLKARNMVIIKRDRRGREHPHLTSVGSERVRELNLIKAERAKARAKKIAGEART